MSREPLAAADRVTDAASIEALTRAREEGVTTSFDRVDAQRTRCKFGTEGVCCRLCHMGPCRITTKSPRGVCGADADTIVARNFLREVAGGVSAHADHGRHLVLLLKGVAEGRQNGYAIRDEKALRRIAALYDVDCESRDAGSVASDLAAAMLREYTAQEEPIRTPSLAPTKRAASWQTRGVLPTGIDRTVVEAMHRTHIGVDHDYRNLLQHAFRAALADGWGDRGSPRRFPISFSAHLDRCAAWQTLAFCVRKP